MGDILYEALVAGTVGAVFSLIYIVYTKLRGKKTTAAERGSILKTYNTKEETPLKFHKFNHYVFLPIRFIYLAIILSEGIANLQYYYDSLVILSILMQVVLGILLFVAFVGLFEWKAYSLYALFAYFMLDVISGANVLISYLNYLPEETSFAIGRFCGALVVSIIICTYYWNRRKLFLHKDETYSPPTCISNPSVDDSKSPNVIISTSSVFKEESFDSETVVSHNSIKFCRKCGKRFLPESAFCSYCGTKIMWEE